MRVAVQRFDTEVAAVQLTESAFLQWGGQAEVVLGEAAPGSFLKNAVGAAILSH
jgi:hypothetical protein